MAGQEEEARPRGGVLLPSGVGLLLFLFGEGEGRKRKEGGRKGGAPPPSPCRIRTWGRGVRPCPGLLSSLPPRPTKAH